MMEETLRDKVALIAGGGRGIGAAPAKLLAARGTLVIVNYLKNEAAAKRVKEERSKQEHLLKRRDELFNALSLPQEVLLCYLILKIRDDS